MVDQFNQAIPYQAFADGATALNHTITILNPYAKKEITYDFESAINIWSYVTYNATDNQVIVFYHVNPGVVISREDIIQHALHDNEETYRSYFKNPPEIICQPETAENFRQVFADPKNYRVGFNSDYYDLLIIAFILAFIEQHNTLPTPEAVRDVNDLIIKPKPLIQRNSYFAGLMRDNGVRFNQKGKLDQRSIFQLLVSVAPKIATIYYTLKQSGYYVDIKLLNEKDKEDSASESVSLKRIAAQLGYRIVEPKNISLADSFKVLTNGEITILLTYNVSDVLVSYLIFKTDAYQNVLNTRCEMLERFKDRYVAKLTANSTSAQFITNTLAPTSADKIVDNPVIETFFPVFGDEFKDITDVINPYYDALKHKDFNWLRQAPLLQGLSEAQFQYLEQHRDRTAVEALDTVFNYYIAQSPKYGPTENGLPRYRIKWGGLERDLLEYMRERYTKFPEQVYELYSCYRNASSREAGILRYVEKHPTPPDNVVYNTKSNRSYNPQTMTPSDIKSISTIVVVKDTRMVLSFSIGGVHGEVIDKESYDRDVETVETFNTLLTAFQQYYPNAFDLYNVARTGTFRQALPVELQNLILHKILFGTAADFEKYIKLFVKTKSGLTKKILTQVDNGNTDAYKLASSKASYALPRKAVNPKDYTITVDLANVLHADVDSLYPSLLILLKVFAVFNNETFEWDDIYRGLRDERLEKKAFAHRIPEEEWTAAETLAEKIQLINKLLLNAASGVLDASYDTNVRANNKAMSMRLCGQLILTALVFAIDELGGESVSTNTDGVYLNNITLEKAEPIIKKWRETYGIGATPEIMKRFVSKDSNNRLEQESAESFGKAAGGTIGNAKGATSSKKMKQPSIVDLTVVEYFKSHPNVNHKPENGYDKKWIKQYLEDIFNEIQNATVYDEDIRAKMLSFMWAKQPPKDVRFGLIDQNGVHTIQNVNRFVLTKTGATLVGMAPKPIASNNKVDSDYRLYHALSHYIATNLSDVERTQLFAEHGLSYNNLTRDMDIAKLLAILTPATLISNELFKDFIVEHAKVLDKHLGAHGVTTLRKSKAVTPEMIRDDLYQQIRSNMVVMMEMMTSLQKLSRQSQLNQFGWSTGSLDSNELTFMKESKVTDYEPLWQVATCNEDVSHYFKHDVWKQLDLDAYVQFVENILDVWAIDTRTPSKALPALYESLGLASE